MRQIYIKSNDTVYNFYSKGIPLENVPELNSSNYLPGGMTALYDAISEGVRIAEKDKTEEERVICVIMTDGEENSSRETTKEQVRNIISGCEATGDWTFLYIGENPEQWTRETGISVQNGIDYVRSAPSENFVRVKGAVLDFRTSKQRQRSDLFQK